MRGGELRGRKLLTTSPRPSFCRGRKSAGPSFGRMMTAMMPESSMSAPATTNPGVWLAMKTAPINVPIGAPQQAEDEEAYGIPALRQHRDRLARLRGEFGIRTRRLEVAVVYGQTQPQIGRHRAVFRGAQGLSLPRKGFVKFAFRKRPHGDVRPVPDNRFRLPTTTTAHDRSFRPHRRLCIIASAQSLYLTSVRYKDYRS